MLVVCSAGDAEPADVAMKNSTVEQDKLLAGDCEQQQRQDTTTKAAVAADDEQTTTTATATADASSSAVTTSHIVSGLPTIFQRTYGVTHMIIIIIIIM